MSVMWLIIGANSLCCAVHVYFIHKRNVEITRLQELHRELLEMEHKRVLRVMGVSSLADASKIVSIKDMQ